MKKMGKSIVKSLNCLENPVVRLTLVVVLVVYVSGLVEPVNRAVSMVMNEKVVKVLVLVVIAVLGMKDPLLALLLGMALLVSMNNNEGFKEDLDGDDNE